MENLIYFSDPCADCYGAGGLGGDCEWNTAKLFLSTRLTVRLYGDFNVYQFIHLVCYFSLLIITAQRFRLSDAI